MTWREEQTYADQKRTELSKETNRDIGFSAQKQSKAGWSVRGKNVYTIYFSMNFENGDKQYVVQNLEAPALVTSLIL